LNIPTEPIGSIPRPPELVEAFALYQAGELSTNELDRLVEAATRATISELENTGSPVVTDGEQRKYTSFATYPLEGCPNVAADGFVLEFASGHTRQLPRLTAGPFRYQRYAHGFLKAAQEHTRRPVKQAVASPSALSLLYPAQGLPGYSRDAFMEDLLREHRAELQGCLAGGAHRVQIDFTEARLAVKLDPGGGLLNSFVRLNNLTLRTFSPAEQQRLGVHTCPGADLDSTHSADVDYAELLPSLFELKVGNFYLAMATEPEPGRVLRLVKQLLQPHQRVYLGVIDVNSARVETPQEICERVLEAAALIPPEQLGTTDDCGFSPFCDDSSTSRDTAFAKIRARVEGTILAERALASRG